MKALAAALPGTLALALLLAPAAPCLAQAPGPREAPPRLVIGPGDGRQVPVPCAVFSPDGKQLLVARMDRTVEALDAATGKRAYSLGPTKGVVLALAFTPDGKLLLAGESSRTVVIWDVARKEKVGVLEGFPHYVKGFAFPAPGKLVTAVVGKPGMKRWDLKTLKEEAAWSAETPSFSDVDVARDGKTFAAMSGFEVIQWGAEQGATLASHHHIKSGGVVVRYAPNGLSVAGGFATGKVDLLDTRNWQRQAQLDCGKRPVSTLAWSPDGKALVTGTSDGKVLLWDVTTLEAPISVALQGHKGAVTMAAFSPDGKTLATGGTDGAVRLWEVERVRAEMVRKEPVPPRPVPGGRPKLALVSTERGPAVLNVLTLAEARLSSGQDVDLLERRAIDRVLQEQKLSLAGLVKEDQAVRAGRLLDVDLFAVVQADPVAKKATGLLVFHAATGVRLWEGPLPEGGVEEGAGAVVQAVRASVRKHEAFERGLRTLCLATVRNADLPRDRDAFCDTVGFLLERGLVSSPTVGLLERTRLDQVLKERNLPTGSPLRHLLASVVRMELEVGRGKGEKAVRATALLFDSQGKQLGRPTVELKDPGEADLAEALTAEVIKAVDAAPASKVLDRVKEASRFAREADYFTRSGDVPRELRARQAAVALNPDDLTQRRWLAVALFRNAVDPLAPYQFGPKYPPEDAVRKALEGTVAALHEQARVEATVRANPAVADPHMQHEAFSIVTLTLMEPRFVKLTPENRELLARVKAEFRALLDARVTHVFDEVKDRKGFAALAFRLISRNHNYLDAMPGEARQEYQRTHLTAWLEVAKKHGTPPLSPKTYDCVYRLLRQAAAVGVDPDALEGYRGKVRESGEAMGRLYERLLDGQLALAKGKLPAEERAEVVRDYRLFVEKLLASPEGRKSPELRYAGYLTANSLGLEDPDRHKMNYGHPVGEELCALGKFMIAQKDVHAGLAQTCYVALARQPMARQTDARALEFVQGLLDIIGRKEATFLVSDPTLGSPGQQRSQITLDLAQARDRILSRYPDLDLARANPWADVVELLDVQGSRKGIVRVAAPVVHDGSVYVAALRQDESGAEGRSLEVLRFSLADGKRTVLGGVRVDTGYVPPTPEQLRHLAEGVPMSDREPFVTDAAVHDGYYHVGTRDKGIFSFPLDGGPPKRLHAGNGLPSDRVQSLACLGNTLYAGLGERIKEAYLVACDLKSGQTTVLASSRRTDRLSVFDDTVPWRVHHLIPDPRRGRVLMTIEVPAKVGLSGLWEIDGKHQFRQLEATHSKVFWVSPIQDDRLMVASYQATTLHDLAGGKSASRRADISVGQTAPYVEARHADIVALLGPKAAAWQLNRGHFLRDGLLWASYPYGRRSVDGTRKSALVGLRKGSTLPFHPVEAFELAGDRVLIADAHGLWLAGIQSPKKK